MQLGSFGSPECACDHWPDSVAYCLLVSEIMTKPKPRKVKPLHKTPVKKIPKPALDFDRDKNLSYLPQDESLDPLLEYPTVFETDVERPMPASDRNQLQKFGTDGSPLPESNNSDVQEGETINRG